MICMMVFIALKHSSTTTSYAAEVGNKDLFGF